MKKSKLIGIAAISLIALLSLTACGSESQNENTSKKNHAEKISRVSDKKKPTKEDRKSEDKIETKSVSEPDESTSVTSDNNVQTDTTATKPTNSVPAEYTRALEEARSYSELLHMSKKGLYDQLVSAYGENISPEAAQYAVDNLNVNYNANALATAKNYQEMDMSPEEIRDQLTSEYGEGFTPEEANYAIQYLNS
ncbi:Ltp family lipoprotein [Companilactobacillus mishanensis]|uniref:Ltp family lipoprotein n=1 Tax=Companilactobacillus mishanensis TaxID=2486008 RepID=UPI00129800A8|nr:Ltp family lipoprotein [Companilactobacillus mishanensis]MQS89266.1 hypothetical protein [Companilactobacillus mishanensis]